MPRSIPHSDKIGDQLLDAISQPDPVMVVARRTVLRGISIEKAIRCIHAWEGKRQNAKFPLHVIRHFEQCMRDAEREAVRWWKDTRTRILRG